MKIRNKLYLMFSLFLVLFAMIGLTIFWANKQINKAAAKTMIANGINHNLNELNIVTYEYLLYHEKRMQQQWHIAYGSASKLLEDGMKKLDRPAEVDILESISKDLAAIRYLFEELETTYKKSQRLSRENILKKEIANISPLEAIWISQLLVKSHHAAFGSLRLHTMAQQEMHHSQRKAGSVIIISTVIFLTILLITGVLIIRSIAIPISRLVEGTHVIGKGNFDHKIDMKSRDEIGELSASFNAMAQNLLDREMELRKSEARYRSLTDDVLDSSEVGIFILDSDFKVIWVNQSLELYFGLQRDDIIGKDKRQLIPEQIKGIFEDPESFAKKVLATYDNNTYIENFECHVISDGKREERWLEHWSQPIQSGLYAGGRIEHYYDITERKLVEKELQERRDANIRLAVAAEERSELQEWINTFDTFVGKFDPNGVGIFFNETPIKAGGVTRDEVVGKYFPDTKWWSHSEIERTRIVECLEKAKAGLASRIETNFRSADGTPVPIIFNCQPVMDNKGEVKYITAEGKTIIKETRLRTELQEAKEDLEIRVRERTSELVKANERLTEEIAERKLAEDHIQHLQNVLMAIRDVNQLIVREKNKKKLLQGACEILTQTQNYKLVWIGLVQEGTRDVLPVAQAGFEEGYLKSIKITWDDSDPGKGPTGTAIKTRKPFVMQDISSDPRYKPWREEAMKRGYASSAAVPLVYEDMVFGALNVYAAIPDSFDEEEVELLSDVSQDIAFALHSIEVEEKRKELEDIVNHSPAVVFLWRSAEGWPVEFVSENVQQFGYIPEDFYSGRILFANIVHPEDLERLSAEVARYSQEGHNDFVQEYRIVTQSGEVRWLDDRTWVRRDSKGVITHYQGIVLDITKRKQAEEELIEHRQSLEQKVKERTEQFNKALTDTEQARAKIDGILKSVADGLIVTDIYNRVILMNHAAEDLLGVRFSDVIDRPVEFAIEEKTLREKFKHTLDKKTTGYQFDFELPGPDTSHPLTMRAITSAIQDKEGRQAGIVTIIHDVTHDREMDRMKTEFISTAAHELRTPLTSIRGFSEILITRDNIGKEERKKFLSYINRQAVNLARIISDLLDISRIESEQGFSLNKVKCNACEIIESITSSYQAISPKHSFDIVLPDKSVELSVDKEKMGQVLINILDNAVKYSPKGGIIRVVGEVLGNDCRVSVEDHGIGMNPEHVEKVFDKFYRVDASDTAPEGTGLGMTIVRYIVEAHGGKVWVESELRKGTTVKLTIPLGLQRSKNAERKHNS